MPPLAHLPASSQTPHRDPDPTRTVLLVEDDPVGLEILSGAFEARGFRVLKAVTGEDAMSLLREASGGVDWLLTDIVLPGQVNGWAIGREYSLSHPNRPLIYISAHAQDLALVAMGARFLAKPVCPQRVAALFEELEAELAERWSFAPHRPLRRTPQ